MNVSEFTDISTATDSLISSIQAFKYTAEESMDVVDILNTIGNNYAISTADLATSLTKSSGSLVAANGTLEEAVALTATANTIIQDADVVGTALKTVAMRLRGTSVEEMEEEGLDTDGAITSTSKLQSKVKGLSGVDILTNTGAYKSTYQILSEIAEVWEDMDDMDQAALLELLAGKRAGSVMSAILQNPETLKDAFESASDASGSALKENEKYLDSIQGKIDLLNNAIQTMWNDTLDSELVKGFVSLSTELVKIIDKIGLIQSLLIGFGAFAIKKNNIFGNIFGEGTQVKLTAAEERLKKAKSDLVGAQAKDGTSNAVSAATMKKYEDAVASAEIEVAELNNELKEKAILNKVDKETTEQSTASTWKELGAQIMKGKVTKDNMVASVKNILVTKLANTALGEQIAKILGVTAAELVNIPVTQLMTVGFKALAGAIWETLAPFLPFIAAAALLVGTIALIAWGMDKAITTTTEYKEELEGLKSEIDSLNSELDSLNDKLDETKERIVELTSKPSLSFVEQEELKNLQLQNEYLEKQIELQEALIKSKKDSQISTAKQVLAGTWDSKSYGKEDYQLDWDTGVIKKDDFWSIGLSGKDAIDKGIEKYAESQKYYDLYRDAYLYNLKEYGAEDDRTILSKQSYDAIKKTMEDQANGINMVLSDMANVIIENGFTYGDDQEVNRYLDEYYAMSLKWQEAQGEYINSKAISSMFDSSASEEMQELGKELQNIADDDILTDDQKNSKIQERINKIDETNEAYSRLNDTMRITGVTAQDIADYFVLETGAYDSNTIEGITKQYADAFNVMRNLKSLANGDVSNQLTKLGADGKVDLLNRPQIETSKLADAGWGDVGGDYATVFTNTYSNEDGTVAMNFTPILPNGSVLSPDELEKYAESVVAGAEDTKGLKIGATFEGENAIEQAVEVAEEIHNLQELYYGMSWDELFTINEDGKFEAQADKFSEILTGIDEDCRRTFMSLATSVKNGELSWEQAMKSFEHSGNLAGLKIIEAQIIELNNTEFSNISDELSGVIDTFGELSAALDDVASSMELLNTAQTQMNNAGQISVKTALEIMQTTDQWNDILEIENGNIKLVGNATEILVEDKIALIKANLQNALATVTEQLAMVDSQNASEDLATTMEESTNQAVRKLAGSMAYLAKMTEAYTRAANGESIDVDDYMSEARAKQEEVEKELNWKLNSANKIGKGDLEKRKAEIEAQLAMLEGIDTASEFKNNYDFDKTPGDKYKDSSSGSDDAFQKAMDYWENRIAANQAKYEQIQNEIDLLEKQGKTAGEDYYKEQVKLENERLKLLQGQRAEAQKHLKRFKEGSDEWWEVASTLNDIESEIDGVTLSLQDLSDTIAQIKWDVFEKSHTRFDNLKGQLETVRELVAPNNEEDWFEDGMWTEKGVAVAGTYIQEIEIDENALEDTQKKLADFAKGYKGNEKYFKNTYGLDSEQEYYDKKQELIEQEQEYAKNINSSKQAVIDMYEAQIDAVEEYTSKLIDSYNEYIDTVKEAIDAERELYEFKKDIAKQTKDIAELERRIASLSGSDNAADIAERRKLEAELAEAKEGLNDSYYAHSKDALQNALEDEATAYEKTMNKFIEKLRESLETATQDMDLFMQGVLAAVVSNAPSILEQYQNLGLSLDDAIVVPWDEASQKIKDFGGVDGLDIMNSWIDEGGVFPTFKTSATDALKSPWEAGKTALGSFKTSVDTEMKNIVNIIKSNVSSAKNELSSLTGVIQDTSKKSSTTSSSSSSSSSSKTSSGGSYYSGGSGYNNGSLTTAQIKQMQAHLGVTADGYWGAKSQAAALKKWGVSTADSAWSAFNQKTTGMIGKYKASEVINLGYGPINEARVNQLIKEGEVSYDPKTGKLTRKPKRTSLVTAFAKGTLSTTHDQFAITDESWIGEEITLAAGKNGQLQYLKKGSAVMPADISANLIEWGKLNPNMMNIANPSAGINLMTNYVSKPELNLSFDALIKAGSITQETLPAVKELVKQEFDRFTKQLNYSIKRVGAN